MSATHSRRPYGWANPDQRPEPRGDDDRGQPLGYCPHCHYPVVGEHHGMFRCTDQLHCGRHWNAQEIIAAEDYAAGERTAAPPAKSINEKLEDHPDYTPPYLDDAPVCPLCGERQLACSCRDADGPTNFREDPV